MADHRRPGDSFIYCKPITGLNPNIVNLYQDKTCPTRRHRAPVSLKGAARNPHPTPLLHLSFVNRHLIFKTIPSRTKYCFFVVVLGSNQSPGDYHRHPLCKGGLCRRPPLSLPALVLGLRQAERACPDFYREGGRP